MSWNSRKQFDNHLQVIWLKGVKERETEIIAIHWYSRNNSIVNRQLKRITRLVAFSWIYFYDPMLESVFGSAFNFYFRFPSTESSDGCDNIWRLLSTRSPRLESHTRNVLIGNNSEFVEPFVAQWLEVWAVGGIEGHCGDTESLRGSEIERQSSG